MKKEYTVPIFLNSNLNPAFSRANSAVINKYNRELLAIPEDLKVNFLEQLWKKEYLAKLISDNLGWCEISFSNKQDYMLFLLRWA